MQTKRTEEIITTSDVEQMKMMYLAEALRRTWKETFVDEDTGEEIEIARNEVIMNKGTLLTNDELSQISFFLQSGDIKEVKVSQQRRACNLVTPQTSVWVAKVEINAKSRNIYLYSNDMKNAQDICIDYIEQKYEGNFSLRGLRRIDLSTLINRELAKDSSGDEEKFYEIEIELCFDNEEPVKEVFILNSPNADEAKKYITEYITLNNQGAEFTVTIMSAKKITCNDIIDVNFCKKYIITE